MAAAMFAYRPVIATFQETLLLMDIPGRRLNRHGRLYRKKRQARHN